MLVHDSSDRVGVGRALPAPDGGAGIVDDADGGRLERDVEADIMALLLHVFLRGGVDTAELTGLFGEQPMPCDYAMSRRLRSGSRSARKGSRDRNASKLGGLPPSVACVSQRLDALSTRSDDDLRDGPFA